MFNIHSLAIWCVYVVCEESERNDTASTRLIMQSKVLWSA